MMDQRGFTPLSMLRVARKNVVTLAIIFLIIFFLAITFYFLQPVYYKASTLLSINGGAHPSITFNIAAAREYVLADTTQQRAIEALDLPHFKKLNLTAERVGSSLLLRLTCKSKDMNNNKEILLHLIAEVKDQFSFQIDDAITLLDQSIETQKELITNHEARIETLTKLIANMIQSTDASKDRISDQIKINRDLLDKYENERSILLKYLHDGRQPEGESSTTAEISSFIGREGENVLLSSTLTQINHQISSTHNAIKDYLNRIVREDNLATSFISEKEDAINESRLQITNGKYTIEQLGHNKLALQKAFVVLEEPTDINDEIKIGGAALLFVAVVLTAFAWIVVLYIRWLVDTSRKAEL